MIQNTATNKKLSVYGQMVVRYFECVYTMCIHKHKHMYAYNMYFQYWIF